MSGIENVDEDINQVLARVEIIDGSGSAITEAPVADALSLSLSDVHLAREREHSRSERP